MVKHLKFTGVVVVIITVIKICGALPCAAYVLKTPQILELTVKQLGKAKALEIKQKLVFFDDQLEGGVAEFDETVKYVFPDTYRSDITADNTSKTLISANEKALAILDDKVVSEYESGFDHYKDILLYRDRIALRHRLVLLGIDTGETRLERINGRIVFVIGEKDSDGSRYPQLYIDKETFLPVKWSLKAGFPDGSGEQLEILFHKWKRIKKTRYPARIEFFKNGVKVREIKVSKITLNPVFDEALFDIEAIKADYADRAANDTEPVVNGGESDVQRKIDGLDDIIEKDQLAF